MTTDPATIYFVGNRIWWSVALFLAPIAGAVAGQATIAAISLVVLMLPSFIFFDTDRPWWPDGVRRATHDTVRSRSETRKLTLASLAALLAGVAVALVRPWA